MIKQSSQEFFNLITSLRFPFDCRCYFVVLVVRRRWLSCTSMSHNDTYT